MGDDDIHLLRTECLCEEKEHRGEKFVTHFLCERLIVDCAMVDVLSGDDHSSFAVAFS